MSKPKAHPAKFLFAYSRCIVFTTVEVLAALALDGWLVVALGLIAAWNVVFMVLLTVGLASLAAGAINAKAAR